MRWLTIIVPRNEIDKCKKKNFSGFLFFVRLSLTNSISIPWARVGYLEKFTGLSLSIKKMVVIVGVSINIHKSPLSIIVSGTNFIVWKYCYFADQEVLTCAGKLYLYFGFKAISHIVNIKHTPFAVTSIWYFCCWQGKWYKEGINQMLSIFATKQDQLFPNYTNMAIASPFFLLYAGDQYSYFIISFCLHRSYLSFGQVSPALT